MNDKPRQWTPTPDTLFEPLNWRKPAVAQIGLETDLFDRKNSFEFIDTVLQIAMVCPQHTFPIFTKDVERMAEYFGRVVRPKCYGEKFGGQFTPEYMASREYKVRSANGGVRQTLSPYLHQRYTGGSDSYPFMKRLDALTKEWFATDFPLENVPLGVWIDGQRTANERIPILATIPAIARILWCPNLLTPLSLEKWIPAGANTPPKPAGYDEWTEEKREKHIDRIATATYMARCEIPFQCVFLGMERKRGAAETGNRPVDIRRVVNQCFDAGIGTNYERSDEQ